MSTGRECGFEEDAFRGSFGCCSSGGRGVVGCVGKLQTCLLYYRSGGFVAGIDFVGDRKLKYCVPAWCVLCAWV